jgi:ribulose kinase
MAIVVDFGTLDVRVSIVDSEHGLLDSAVVEYPLHRKREDLEYATQSHDDHMLALASAMREAVRKAGVSGRVEAVALDTTGSSVIPVGKNLRNFAFLAAGTFKTVEEAQEKICPPHRQFDPEAPEQTLYDQLYPMYGKLYFAFGQPGNDGISHLHGGLHRSSTHLRT